MRTTSKQERTRFYYCAPPQLRVAVRWEPALMPHLRREVALSYSLFSREELARAIPGPDPILI